MAKVDVCYFERYEINEDKVVRSKRPATREAIQQCGGTVLEDTCHQVDESLLDGNGFALATESE